MATTNQRHRYMRVWCNTRTINQWESSFQNRDRSKFLVFSRTPNYIGNIHCRLNIFASVCCTMKQFFGEDDTAKDYIRYRPVYSDEIVERIISFLAEKRKEPYELALDVGCGSGQLTRPLSSHFSRVIGVDISPAQINAAHTVQNPRNVTFKVGRAECLPVDDASVDIITSATASHYFNWDIFGKEVDRVLKHNGCLVALSYNFFYIDRPDSEAARKLVECIDSYVDYMSNAKLRKSTPEGYLAYQHQYKENLPLSYTEQERISMTMRKTMNVRQFIEFYKTWANFIQLRMEDPNGTTDHFEAFEKSLMELLDGVDPEATQLDVWSPVYLRCARKT